MDVALDKIRTARDGFDFIFHLSYNDDSLLFDSTVNYKQSGLSIVDLRPEL